MYYLEKLYFLVNLGDTNLIFSITDPAPLNFGKMGNKIAFYNFYFWSRSPMKLCFNFYIICVAILVTACHYTRPTGWRDYYKQ